MLGTDSTGRSRPILPCLSGGPSASGTRWTIPTWSTRRASWPRGSRQDLPTLGVCLGAQLMASALGSRVYPGERKEIGWGRLDPRGRAAATPLRHLADAPVLHWHGDTFDLPDGATPLASSPLTRTKRSPWADRSRSSSTRRSRAPRSSGGSWGTRSSSAQAGIDVPRLRSDSHRHALAAARAGRALIDEYVASLSEAPEPQGPDGLADRGDGLKRDLALLVGRHHPDLDARVIRRDEPRLRGPFLVAGGIDARSEILESRDRLLAHVA